MRRPRRERRAQEIGDQIAAVGVVQPLLDQTE
jgi:hypothetical protein